MKRLIYFAITILLFVSSCTENPTTLNITLPVQNGEYHLIISGRNGYRKEITSTLNSLTINMPEPGVYDINCSLFISGKLEKEERITTRIKEGVNEIPIPLGDSIAHLVIDLEGYEDYASSIIRLSVKGESGRIKERQSSIDDKATQIIFNDIEMGLNKLIVEIIGKNGEIIFCKKENLMIEEGINRIRLLLENEGIENGEMGFKIENMSALPIEGRIEITEIDMKKGEITLSFVLYTEVFDDITILWYENGKFIHEGETLIIESDSSPKRIDAIAYSEKPGSAGSFTFKL